MNSVQQAGPRWQARGWREPRRGRPAAWSATAARPAQQGPRGCPVRRHRRRLRGRPAWVRDATRQPMRRPRIAAALAARRRRTARRPDETPQLLRRADRSGTAPGQASRGRRRARLASLTRSNARSNRSSDTGSPAAASASPRSTHSRAGDASGSARSAAWRRYRNAAPGAPFRAAERPASWRALKAHPSRGGPDNSRCSATTSGSAPFAANSFADAACNPTLSAGVSRL